MFRSSSARWKPPSRSHESTHAATIVFHRVSKKAARCSARDNKHMVPLAALLRIAKAGYVLPDIIPVADIQAATDEPI
jgi:hypothetical protein